MQIYKIQIKIVLPFVELSVWPVGLPWLVKPVCNSNYKSFSKFPCKYDISGF